MTGVTGVTGGSAGRRLKLFFDGGCRPNPGPMEVAVVARGALYHRADIGRGSNSEAEWQALLYAVEIANQLGARDVELVGDAAHVVQQARGTWPCRTPALRAHLARFQAGTAAFTRLRIRHIGRFQNLAGIALETMPR